MASDWPVLSLDSLSLEVTVGFVGSMAHEYVDEGIPFLRSKNIGVYNVIFDDMKYVTQEFHEKIRKSSLKPGDVAIVRTGKPGTTCVIPDSLPIANCSDLVLVRVDESKLCPHYLSYYMNSAATQHVESHIVGAVQQHFNVGAAKKIMIPLPSRIEQDRIVYTLKTIDDKIQLNRQTNQTLEKMAQALFKSWFVDFDPVIDNAIAAGKPIPEELQARAQRRQIQIAKPDHKPLADDIRQLFPSELEETEDLGWVPKGWGVINVENLVSRLKAGKRYAKKAVSLYGQVPVYEQGQSILLGYHDEEANFLASVENPVFIFGDHTCVTKLGVEPFSISANVIPLKGGLRNTYWTYFAVKDLQKFEEYRRHWMEFAIKPVVLPSVELADFFADLVKASTQKAKDNDKSSNSLERLRDTLLPKLISGELRIPEAQQLSDDVLADENLAQKEGCL
ncbi:MAG: restriction endonuclease subunit S [Cycloclasticus sp.]